MRPAGRGPLESLYFKYPEFPTPTVVEQQGERPQHPVAIVGAGPIGMTAALTLARFGVRSILLDRKTTFNDGSRAICIARASFHILEQIGAVAPFLGKGLPWRHGRSYFRGQQIYRLEMPHSADDKYLPMYNLQQQYIEQFLWNAIGQCPLIETRWGSEVRGLAQSSDDVTLQVGAPTGSYELKAGYVLAADGARSAVRSLLGLRLKGENHEGRYVIADVRMAHDFPTERRAFFEPASNPGKTVLIHKQPDDIWRLDYQLGDDESESAAIAEPEISARVQSILDDIGHTGPWELEWWSIYSANTLCLDEYRHGRVLFIGDSGHIVPIFGVRGLNNGLADAFNAGWKLAYVLSGGAEYLLDSYTPERRGATLDVFANASKSTRFMTPPTRGWALAREAALSLALHHPFAGEFANPRQMQPFTYADSPLTPFPETDRDFAAGPLNGALAHNVKIDSSGFLLDHAGAGFTALFFADTPLAGAEIELLQVLAQLDPRFKPLIIAGQGRDIPGTHLQDSAGRIAAAYGATDRTVYLLRPDLHVAGRWRTLTSEQITHTLRVGVGKATA